MPNIELHGYGRLVDSVKRKVRVALRDHPDAQKGGIVTTMHPTRVEDFNGKAMPFLRVIATTDELSELARLLAPLHEDIEVMVLDEWIPKRA